MKDKRCSLTVAAKEFKEPGSVGLTGLRLKSLHQGTTGKKPVRLFWVDVKVRNAVTVKVLEDFSLGCDFGVLGF